MLFNQPQTPAPSTSQPQPSTSTPKPAEPSDDISAALQDKDFLDQLLSSVGVDRRDVQVDVSVFELDCLWCLNWM